MMKPTWPKWQDFLISPETGLRPVVEGGLRLSGMLKHDRPELPLVSYVTVVRNNDRTLARTIESVIAQSYPNVEHIILDGNSIDCTLNVIESYADKLDYYVSEMDTGLYDALNKAIPLARGSLICVLNSDDWLEADAATNMVRASAGLSLSALILSTARVDTGNHVITWQPAHVSLVSYFTCANCCHNAIYATRAAYEAAGPYDIDYEIAADFKWIMRCFDTGAVFSYTDIPTVNYSLGGISGDGAHHRLECQKLIRDRFSYLSPEEISGLHYCYYSWRDRLDKSEVGDDFNPELFLQALCKKYYDKVELLQALDQSALNSVNCFGNFKDSFKSWLIQYPRAFTLISRFYSLLLSGRK